MTKPLAYIGIDPGAQGAVALLVPDLNLVSTYPLKNKIPIEIFHYLQKLADTYEIKALSIEDVHSIFGMSAKSNFSFGWNVGMINTLGSLVAPPVFHIQPKKWQKGVGVTEKGKQIKQNVADLCDQLYPQAKEMIRGIRGGLLDGHADALMIAHYTYLTFHDEEK